MQSGVRENILEISLFAQSTVEWGKPRTYIHAGNFPNMAFFVYSPVLFTASVGSNDAQPHA